MVNDTDVEISQKSAAPTAEKPVVPDWEKRMDAEHISIRDHAREVVAAIDSLGEDASVGKKEGLLAIDGIESIRSRVAKRLGKQEEEPPSTSAAEVLGYLKSAEQYPPNMDAHIDARLKPTDPEYHQLLEQGIPQDVLDSNALTRQQLLDAGFVFMNKIGRDREKSIMSGTFEDPDTPGKMLDFTDRTLLTKEELDKVYRYQQLHPETYGLHGEELDEVRKDMLSYLYAATREPVLRGASEMTNALTMAFRSYSGKDGDKPLLEEFWNTQAQAYMREHPEETNIHLAKFEAQKIFVRKYCPDLYDIDDEPPAFGIKTERDHYIKAISLRREKLSGQPSPFLDLGFVFRENPDAEVGNMQDPAAPNESRLYRLNMGNIHIFGGHPEYPGLSEMGGAHADQQYMPLGAYVDQIYSKDPEARAALQADEQIAFAPKDATFLLHEAEERAVIVARKWKDTQMRSETDFSLKATRHRLDNMRRELYEDRTWDKTEKVEEKAAEGNVLAKKAIRESSRDR